MTIKKVLGILVVVLAFGCQSAMDGRRWRKESEKLCRSMDGEPNWNNALTVYRMGCRFYDDEKREE